MVDGGKGMIDAAIFDLDGVVTFTARVHAAAWKRLFDEFLRAHAERTGTAFREFTDDDYRTYVDGRPRFDGVRTFLASRDIRIDEGNADDPADAATVHALGQRKNALFQAELQTSGVDVDDKAVAFIRMLRNQGIQVGVASSSRNTEVVLQRAALEDLFDARVDGEVSAQLGLEGKPAPDIFVKCLELLGVADPARAIVFEDADAGVEAGRAGHFGLVIGVDRGGRGISLREHGADWVISDFSELTLERIESYLDNRVHLRPNALAHWSEIASQLRARRPAIFLDYDGTLTPIVARPDLAVLSDDMRATLQTLAGEWPVTIVSGRGREDVTKLVGLQTLTYAGSHGFDIAGPCSRRATRGAARPRAGHRRRCRRAAATYVAHSRGDRRGQEVRGGGALPSGGRSARARDRAHRG